MLSDDEAKAALANIKRQRQHRERVGRLADKYIPPKPTDDDNGVADRKGDVARPPKQADVLIDLAESATLFHAPPPNADAYADILIDGHRETHRVRGAGFRRWLRHQFFKVTGGGCNSEAIQAAIETIAARAQFEGEECAVHIRVAKHGAAIYIDL